MENNITWLFGMEKYFQFINDIDKKEIIRNIINLKYTESTNKPWSLKNLISDDYKKYPELGREDRINFYTNVCTQDNVTTEEIIHLLHSIWPNDDLISKLVQIVIEKKQDILPIIFSKGQVFSKVWMAEILSKFNLKFDNILLIGGWLTHHSLYFKDISYNKLFSIDPDETINNLAAILNPESYIENKDINDCIWPNGNISFYNKMLRPDLIINTSSEHMNNTWYDRLLPGTLVFIENNNSTDETGHINSSESFPDFLRKYPMNEILYRGELTLSKYKRYALYGRK